MVLIVVLLFSGVTKASSTHVPVGWSFFAWPYAYEVSSAAWYYHATANTHLCADLSSGIWGRLGANALSSGWSYWRWPWAYHAPTARWYYANEGDNQQWVANMTSGAWRQMGSVKRNFTLTWAPGKFVGQVHLGDAHATVRYNMGVPSEIYVTTNDNSGEFTLWNTYNAQGLRIALEDLNQDGVLQENEPVDGIFIDNYVGNPPAYAYQGIILGSSQSAATAVLGPPQSQYSTSTSLTWYNLGVQLMYPSGDPLRMIYVLNPF
jgi:hypothetical protein